jgi:predicted chitinase
MTRELNHDAGGFLVGPKVTDDLDKIARELALLREIRGNTEETVEQLGRLVDAVNSANAFKPVEPNRPPMPPRGPDERSGLAMIAPALPGAAAEKPASAGPAPAVQVDVPPIDIEPIIVAHAPASVAPIAPGPATSTATVSAPGAASQPGGRPLAQNPGAGEDTRAAPAPPAVAPGAPPSATTSAAAPDTSGSTHRQARDEQGRFASAAPGTPAHVPLPTGDPIIADPRQARIAAEEQGRRRDAQGRFERAGADQEAPEAGHSAQRRRGADGRFGSGDREDAGSSETRTSKAMGAASESLKSVADGLSHGADNVDPAVTAAKELGGIVSPVVGAVKPLGRLFGMGRTPEDKRQRQAVVWYRRIWGELREGNKKSGGRGMGLVLTGLLSMLGMLLSPLRALARMTGMLKALGALGGLAKGLGGLRGRGDRGGRGRRGTRGADGGRRGQGANARRQAIDRRGRRAAEARHITRNRETGRFESRTSTRPGSTSSRTAASSAGSGTASSPDAARAKEKRAAIRSRRAGRTAPAEVVAEGSGRATRAGLGEEAGAPSRASKAARAARGAGKVGKKLLTKIPVLGAVLGAGLFAQAAMAKDDPNATPEEQRAQKADRWGAMGGLAGGVLGGALGMVGGPAGAIVGNMLGDQLGTAVGEWLSTVDMTGMMADISSAWTTVADGAFKMASDSFTAVKDGWSSVVAAGSSMISGMADWAKESWGKVADAYYNVKDKLVETFTEAREKVVSTYRSAKDTVQDKAYTARDYINEKRASIQDVKQNALYKISGGRYTGGSNARKDELIKAMDAGGITDEKSKAALMANVDHESGGFKAKGENLNYSAKRLQEVFPKYYKDAETARADAGNPEAIANRVYGGRMGNKDPGDGFKYRGRGDIQLTGRDQYERMGQKLGIDLVNNPELASDPRYSAQIAVQHWKDSGANELATRGDIKGARRRTNGGTNGWSDVEAKYEGYLAQANAGDLTPTRKADDVRVAAPKTAMGAIGSTLAKVKGQPAGAAAGPVGVLAAAGQKNGAAAPKVGAALSLEALATPLVKTPVSVPGSPGAMAATPAAPGALNAGSTTGAPGGSMLAGMGVMAGPTPLQVAAKGSSMPLGMMPMTPVSLAPVTPAANPASVQARAPAMVSGSAPAAVPPIKVPSYSAPAPDASHARIPATPQVAKPMPAPSKTPAAPAGQVLAPLSQNISDRAIAHAATGGIGMGGTARSL